MLNPSIILAGQSPDIVNALANSNTAAQQRIEFDRTNAMNRMLQEQGAGIIAGDQNALNALAGYDPMAALGVQDARLGMDATRQQMSISAERLAMEKAEGKRMAEAAMAAQAAQLSAEQLAAEKEQITSALSGAASFYQKGDRAGYDAWLAKLGLDPREYSFDEFPAHAAMFEGVLEAMQTFAPPDPTKGAPSGFMFSDPNNPSAGVTPLPGYTKTPDTVVNVGGEGGPQTEIGSIPQGFAAVPDPASPAGYRMVPIPGGPEDRTRTDAKAADNASIASDTVVTATKRAIEATREQTLGAPGTSIVAAIPGVGAATPSGEKVRQMNVLKAQAIVGNLQAMRDASPTGGALGAVTKPELDMLAAKSGALDPDSPTFERDVLDYTRTLLQTIHGKEAGDKIFRQEFGGEAPEAPAAPKRATEMSDDEFLESLGLK